MTNSPQPTTIPTSKCSSIASTNIYTSYEPIPKLYTLISIAYTPQQSSNQSHEPHTPVGTSIMRTKNGVGASTHSCSQPVKHPLLRRSALLSRRIRRNISSTLHPLASPNISLTPPHLHSSARYVVASDSSPSTSHYTHHQLYPPLRLATLHQ